MHRPSYNEVSGLVRDIAVGLAPTNGGYSVVSPIDFDTRVFPLAGAYPLGSVVGFQLPFDSGRPFYHYEAVYQGNDLPVVCGIFRFGISSPLVTMFPPISAAAGVRGWRGAFRCEEYTSDLYFGLWVVGTFSAGSFGSVTLSKFNRPDLVGGAL